MKNETQENLVELGNKVIGEIILPSVDISPYIGKKIKIANIKEYEGNYGYYIRIESETIAILPEVINPNTNKPVELKATRLFGLQTDKDGNIGWGQKTKLGLFLKKKNLASYRDLVGVEVITTSVTNSDDGKDYLSFN